MTNDTDLANHALALISEGEISNINQRDSKAARVCKQFATQARQEVLRMARWNCATRRAELVEKLPRPKLGYAHRYQLPTDFLRLLEVNGESAKASDEYFEIEERILRSDATVAWIRYTADIGIGACDSLLKAAIVTRLASKISVPLSGRLDQTEMLEGLFRRRLAEARHADAAETHGGENAGWEKMLSRSRLARVRSTVRNPLRREG
jgi:hypothetical protein